MSAKTVMKIQIAMHQIKNANIVHRTLFIPHSVASMTGSSYRSSDAVDPGLGAAMRQPWVGATAGAH